MHTVGPGIRQETWKFWKKGNTQYRKWNLSRNTHKHGKWEINNVEPDYGKKIEKRGNERKTM
jgi:hypothetical protein